MERHHRLDGFVGQCAEPGEHRDGHNKRTHLARGHAAARSSTWGPGRLELHRARSEILGVRLAAAVLRPDPTPPTHLDAESAALKTGPRRVDREHLRPIEADHDLIAEGRGLGELMPVVVGPSEPTRWQFQARDLVPSKEPGDRVDDLFDDWGHAIILGLSERAALAASASAAARAGGDKRTRKGLSPPINALAGSCRQDSVRISRSRCGVPQHRR